MKKRLVVFVIAAVFLLSSVTPAFATSWQDGWWNMPVVKKNSNNGAAEGALWVLRDTGFLKGSGGGYWEVELSALKAYQKARKLTVDGSIGEKTWAKMRKELSCSNEESKDWNYCIKAWQEHWKHIKASGAWYEFGILGGPKQKMCD